MEPLKRADLQDGSLLKDAVKEYREHQGEDTLLNLMVLLRNTQVWIPCEAVLSEKDQKRLDILMSGAKTDAEAADLVRRFVTEDEVQLIPDILQNGDDLLFPIFSSVEEMGRYGQRFSKVRKDILEAIQLAETNIQEPAGIVLNAFTDPFELRTDLYDLLRNLNPMTFAE